MLYSYNNPQTRALCYGGPPASTCITSSSSPDILFFNSAFTRSTTRSRRAYVVPRVEYGSDGSNEAAEGASWMWIDPMNVEASLGQKRGEV